MSYQDSRMSRVFSVPTLCVLAGMLLCFANPVLGLILVGAGWWLHYLRMQVAENAETGEQE